jgi:hypothetical protein
MNRQQRRALSRAERTQAGTKRRLPTVSLPGWAQAEDSKRDQALKEAIALQSLLAHTGTDDDMGHWSSLLEISLRICKHLDEQRPDYLDLHEIHCANRTFTRAAWGLHKAMHRKTETGVYGFDASDRAALIEAENYVAAFRESVPRLVWARAIREALAAKAGIPLTPLEQLEAA